MLIRASAILSLFLTIGVALPLGADSTHAQMQVSAVVIARALLDVQQQPESVLVTATDVERGYTNVEAPFVIVVRTNSRKGYLLEATNTDRRFAAVEMVAGGLSMRVSDQSWIDRPYSGIAGERLELHVRLVLGSDAHEGRYPFPIAVSARPLA